MKRLIIFCLLLNSEVLIAQENSILLRGDEIFVVKMIFKEKLFKGIPTCTGNSQSFTMYKVKIDTVLFSAVNQILPDSQLIFLQYVLVDDLAVSEVHIDSIVTSSLGPMSSKFYLTLHRIFDIDNRNNYYHSTAYISSLIGCKNRKKDKFERFILRTAH